MPNDDVAGAQPEAATAAAPAPAEPTEQPVATAANTPPAAEPAKETLIEKVEHIAKDVVAEVEHLAEAAVHEVENLVGEAKSKIHGGAIEAAASEDRGPGASYNPSTTQTAG